MRLTYFNHVVSCLNSSKNLKKWKITFYRYNEKAWIGPNGSINNTSLLNELQKVKNSKSKPPIKNSSNYYVHVESIKSVLSISVPKGTYSSKVSDYVTSLFECIEQAEHSYFATHDVLTGIYNRVGAEKEILKLITKPDINNAENEAFKILPQYGLIALDIDHFKQINDSYGHSYGDAVLKAFSWRLQDAISELEKIYSSTNQTYIFSRPGGEEFEIFVSDLQEPETLEGIADFLLKKIRETQIPDNDQLEIIARELNLDAEKCPKLAQRTTYASLGLAIGRNIKLAAKDVYTELRGKADIALYRAKADKRNCARSYDDIKLRHGKIIEHFEDSNLVLIDIGDEVGVIKGDVYKVYLPKYNGDTPYEVADQRSTKQLGIYPKLTCGQVAVIDVQQNISFCRIIEKSIPTSFTTGSTVEYIPVGLDRPPYESVSPSKSGYLLNTHQYLDTLSKLINNVTFLGLIKDKNRAG